MQKSPEVEAAIRRGLAFLGKRQEADGSFVSFSSASMQPFRSLRTWQTTFVPALMLASLAVLDTAEALAIRKKLAVFLLEQKDANWSFNYWARKAPEQKTQPYPNDLDDTFCALAGLYLHDPAIIDEEVLAKAVKLLLATETSVGGPYRTWLVAADSEPVWLDVDVAVNSNIAYFLSLVSNRLPKLDDLMGGAILAGTFSSPYYPSVYAFIYYFSRSYGGPHKDQLLVKARLLYKSAQTDLDRALSLAALLRLGETRGLATKVNELLSGQRRDGSWPAAVFYADPVKNGKLYYNGAPALTTAFALEALQLYSQSGNRLSRTLPSRRAPAQNKTTTEAVLELANKQCRQLPKDLRLITARSLSNIAKSGDGPEIISLAQRFNQSLIKPLRPASSGFLENLSLANLYGWLAYTVYDDFLDEEGQPGLLPAANVAMRKSLYCFLESLPSSQSFQGLVRQTFDVIDGANAWEVINCRYERKNAEIAIRELPDFGDLSKLAERSLGHTLAPMAILFAKHLDGSPAVEHTRQALADYIIVRQLNDDLHDWQADLENGQVTYVVASILSGLRIKPGNYKLTELVAQARQQFWYKTLPRICHEMLGHASLGRQALGRAGIFKDVNIIGQLLDGLEASIRKTLSQQGKAENFLKHYESKAVNA